MQRQLRLVAWALEFKEDDNIVMLFLLASAILLINV